MATAWPRLKKLDFNWQKKTAYTSFPLSHLADIVAEFPELEELGALFDYNTNDSEGHLLPTYEPSSAPCHPPRLQKLRLGWSRLPGYKRNRDSMAQFLARVCPPGLRIERMCLEGTTNDPVRLTGKEKITTAGRDVDPEWDALFQKIEELQGGVRIWVGKIPEESDGVWF
ncbi:hypothetical protein M407DRAFT_181042 [Tulasnella calospora MUT 4182]|uniref:Uncharacterized protein n=1 Tax=Tulasnella calospora MUT 4182 TaxID=1051891 RepID=A0A0C3M473_9AGAM|nr:hypothetical protein M407DRAFT_181042 [Tulasnella calospora MUT 4182]